MTVKRILQKFLVQVQSRWFPLSDRNPQLFVDIYHAKPEDFRIATQRVHGSAEHAARITRSLLPSEMKP
jgi:predicted acyl esterase